jgi:putative membrane protein
VAEPTAQAPPASEAEPDYRFTLANERTYLAWVRTTLALVAAAVAVVHVAPPLAVARADVALGVLLAGLALATSLLGYRRWHQNERAIRRAAPLPRTRGMAALSAGLALAVGSVAVLLLLELA